MKVLIAEDDTTSRRVLQAILLKWEYDVESVCDGGAAWAALRREDAPRLAILDWMMPELDGVEVCRKVRELDTETPIYIILLTAMDRKEHIVEGLGAGANDYVTKPFDRNELRARVEVGRRVIQLQTALATRVQELKEALEHIETLQGVLPICMHCKRIRDDQESWQRLESYIEGHSGAQFSHGLCPECRKKHYPDFDHDGMPHERGSNLKQG